MHQAIFSIIGWGTFSQWEEPFCSHYQHRNWYWSLDLNVKVTAEWKKFNCSLGLVERYWEMFKTRNWSTRRLSAFKGEACRYNTSKSVYMFQGLLQHRFENSTKIYKSFWNVIYYKWCCVGAWSSPMCEAAIGTSKTNQNLLLLSFVPTFAVLSA